MGQAREVVPRVVAETLQEVGGWSWTSITETRVNRAKTLINATDNQRRQMAAELAYESPCPAAR
ncbi:hypothetical protein OHR68_32790 [Spirillospora sp. NBC_00431]